MNLPPGIPGLVHVATKSAVPAAIARLESLIAARGMRVFARIDFAADAAREGLSMRPMVQLVFGNPKAGTPLLAAAPTIGIDLPLKVLAWEDEGGGVWLTYYDPDTLAQRHQVPADLAPRIAGIRGLVAEAARAAG